jgi:peptidoglycan/LPS O-acetylase OafA/YrhL
MEETRVDALQAGRRLPELDGLRGLAVLLVVFLHWVVRLEDARSFTQTWPAWLFRFGNICWCGVDLFFVLSGFLIGGILLDHRGSPRLLKAFYARRVARIFPAYFLLIGLVSLASLSNPSVGVRGTVPLVAFVFFAQNFWMSAGAMGGYWLGPCWSIAIEEQFYLVAPSVIARISERTLKVVLAASIVGPLALRTVAIFFPGWLSWFPFQISPWSFTLCRIDGLAFGVWGAWAMREVRLRERLQRLLPAMKGALALLVVVIFLLSQATAYPWGDSLQMSIGLTILALASLLAILVSVLDSAGVMAAVFRTPLLMTIGTCSYFVYLFHMPVMEYVTREPRPFLWSFLIAVVALAVLASLSWQIMEQPFLRLGHRVGYELERGARQRG